MPKCSFCGLSYFKVNALITHLKYIHQCQENSIFHCAEINCNRSFPLLKSYRKHLSIHTNALTQIGKDYKVLPNHSLLPENGAKLENTDNPEQIGNPEIIKVYLSEPDPENSFMTFKNKLYDNNIIFISKLYSESTFSRKDIQKIINAINNLLFEPMDIFEKSIKQILKNYDHNDQTFMINKFFEEFNNLFKGFETEFLRFKILENSKLFIKPITFSVGEGVETKNSIPITKKYTAEFIPLSDVLKYFFSMPGVLHETVKYVEHLKHQEVISNIIQTGFWKSKISDFNDNTLVFPLFIYYDDFESGNPLGSHSGIHKLGGVYCSVACLPPKYRSQLENIFLLTLFHTSDLKEFGPSVIFSPMIEEVNKLRTEGITIVLPTGKSHIYFNTVLFLGDNLALNTILGFQESFSANSFCRFCKCLRTETQSCTFEDKKKMRNCQNYAQDLVTNFPYLTGVKIDCVLNKILSFHVTANFSVDIAHDILEGVAGVVMVRLLNQFVFVDKFFDIEMLNNRIKFYNFSPNHNKPPLISLEYLKKKTLKMSASEMKTFVLNAGLIFGDLIPTGNTHWKLFIFLRKILNIIFKNFIDENMIHQLKDLIHEHHSLFLNLFQETLRPKFHFMTHYPSVLEKSGPLSNLATLRYESKHRQFKLSANVISSRVNITHSLAIKHQLQLCFRFSTQRGFTNNISYTPVAESLTFSEIISDSKPVISNNENTYNFEDELSSTNKVMVNSKFYRINDVLCINSQNNSFVSIKNIIINKQDDIMFLCEEMSTVSFSEHFFAFQLKKTGHLTCVFYDDLDLLDTLILIPQNKLDFVSM